MIAYIIFFLIAFSIPFAFAEPTEYVIGGGEKGIRLVPVYYVDRVYCNDFGLHDVGCYDPNADYITIKTGYRDVWTQRGCTVLQHEQAHAWGLNEPNVGKFAECPNPHIDPNRGQYDPDNFFHFDPMYIHVPYEIDPRCQSHFVNKPDNCGRQETHESHTQ